MGRALRSVPVKVRPHRDGDQIGTACAAATVQLRLEATGVVTTCCRSLQPLGHIGRERLIDIWRGERRRRLVDALATWDFSHGCQPCGAEIAQEGRPASYAAIHDEYLLASPGPDAVEWPRRMEFNLSNACNLQCIQCDGESSSSIRLHREGRPPLPPVYDDRFFEDLRLFLPHLDHIVFAGGEPFMSRENRRVWEMIADEAPHVRCQAVTNATQWGPSVERVLDRIPMHFIFSLDGITAATYERIRVGADFGAVMANVERFRDYVAERGTTASVNHCLMPQNHAEFADLLLWAEERDLFVNVSVVRTPNHASIAQLDADELRAVHETLRRRDEEMRSSLRLNLRTWSAELDRIGSWAEASAPRSGAGASTSSHTLVWFRTAGTSPHDDADARSSLTSLVGPDRLGCVEVVEGDVVRSADLPFLPPEAAAGLVGQRFHELQGAMAAGYGPMNDYEVLATTDDELTARAVFGTTSVRVTSVAMRDEQGWARSVRFLVAVEGVVGEGGG